MEWLRLNTCYMPRDWSGMNSMELYNSHHQSHQHLHRKAPFTLTLHTGCSREQRVVLWCDTYMTPTGRSPQLTEKGACPWLRCIPQSNRQVIAAWRSRTSSRLQPLRPAARPTVTQPTNIPTRANSQGVREEAVASHSMRFSAMHASSVTNRHAMLRHAHQCPGLCREGARAEEARGQEAGARHSVRFTAMHASSIQPGTPSQAGAARRGPGSVAALSRNRGGQG